MENKECANIIDNMIRRYFAEESKVCSSTKKNKTINFHISSSEAYALARAVSVLSVK